MKHRYPWPPDKVALLRRLLAQGCCDAEIARQLSTTRRAVNGKRWRLRLEANWQRPRAPELPPIEY